MRDGGAVFLVIVTRLVVEDAVSYVSLGCRPYNDPYPYPVLLTHVRYVSRSGLSRPAVMIVIFLTQFTRLAHFPSASTRLK